jgi:hypothetical protein
MGAVMNNTIIYLIGLGKFTIGKEISKRTGARLIDNQLINNPIFSVAAADGSGALPEIIWDRIGAIRRIILDAIHDISPAHFSFIFTNVLFDNSALDAEYFADIAELVQQRHAKFIPVRLLCSEDELCRRVVFPERIERFKTVDAENARKTLHTCTILRIEHPNALTLDVTTLPATEAADCIIRHAAAANV